MRSLESNGRVLELVFKQKAPVDRAKLINWALKHEIRRFFRIQTLILGVD
jgi:hypothetical protein